MALATDSIASRQYQLTTARVFKAPRALVFSAWSADEHVRNWFSPEHFTVPDACVEFRVGGRFDVCMRAPDGTEHWTRGIFLEIVRDTRLVIDMTVPGPDGQPLFNART
ncbi:MAG TPA: SRPBCC domain-containing protein, partial [Telluria sp.]|nr:SRPBCC domain-containing protein [Telluria sp.]